MNRPPKGKVWQAFCRDSTYGFVGMFTHRCVADKLLAIYGYLVKGCVATSRLSGRARVEMDYAIASARRLGHPTMIDESVDAPLLMVIECGSKHTWRDIDIDMCNLGFALVSFAHQVSDLTLRLSMDRVSTYARLHCVERVPARSTKPTHAKTAAIVVDDSTPPIEVALAIARDRAANGIDYEDDGAPPAERADVRVLVMVVVQIQ